MLTRIKWKNVSVFKTFYPKETVSRDNNSNDLEYRVFTPLLFNGSIVEARMFNLDGIDISQFIYFYSR